jgi:hypothetical protein
MLIMLISVVAVVALYGKIFDNGEKKAEKEFCKIECKNYNENYFKGVE